MKNGSWQYWVARAVVVFVVLPLLGAVGRAFLRKVGVMRPKDAPSGAAGSSSGLADLDWKVKAAAVLGAVLSWPVFRGWSDGTIGTNAALFRVGIAMAFAYVGIYVVATVVQGYLPEPEPEPEEETPELEGVEDAFIVDQLQAHEETTAEG